MDWRVWTKTTLDAYAALTAEVDADAIFGAGPIDEPPGFRPFIELRFSGPFRGPFPGVSYTNLTVWVHDDPGDYMRIDAVIALVKDALSGVEREKQVSEANAVCARWLGDSDDLVDDGYHTISRNAVFQLSKKEM